MARQHGRRGSTHVPEVQKAVAASASFEGGRAATCSANERPGKLNRAQIVRPSRNQLLSHLIEIVMAIVKYHLIKYRYVTLFKPYQTLSVGGLGQNYSGGNTV